MACFVQSHARFTCASFSMGYCVVGDSEGAVTVIQYGNCVAKLDAAATAHAGHEGKTDSTEQSSGCCLVDIAPFEQGFVTATHSGVMSVFMTGEHDRCAKMLRNCTMSPQFECNMQWASDLLSGLPG